MDVRSTSNPALPSRREFIARAATAGSLLVVSAVVPSVSSASSGSASKWVNLGEIDIDPTLSHSPSSYHVMADRWPASFSNKPGNFTIEIRPTDRPHVRTNVSAQASLISSGGAFVNWVMPEGLSGKCLLRLGSDEPTKVPRMTARQTGDHFEICEGNQRVLQYNYGIVNHPELAARIAEPNRKYAVARSNYIHPLYGLSGEELTLDWPVDHPHHRGIYWAWPEVDWEVNRGDLHALQKVFSRPTGVWSVISGPVFAEIKAENFWTWESGVPIVREFALMRCFARGPNSRLVDLELVFEALDKPVRIARREALHYGGLNIRLNSIRGQEITKSTARTPPQESWGNISGNFPSAHDPGGLIILQSPANPDFPGDWIEYPKLNWLQPTFPGSGSRYELRKAEPLRLTYRLVIYSGKISATEADFLWKAAWHRF